jgi:mono/diheme cytochrome c family protein
MSSNANSIKSGASPSAEPRAGAAAMPVWLIIAMLVTFFGGALYFDAYGGWFSPRVYAPYHSEPQLALFQPASGADRAMQLGKIQFEKTCALCHGYDGMGKPGQFPPFVGSDWVLTDKPGQLIPIPLNGLGGTIKVAGVEYSFPTTMPAMGSAMSDEELAAVLTYMRNSWGNKASEITPEQVKAVRAAVGNHPSWTPEELRKQP